MLSKNVCKQLRKTANAIISPSLTLTHHIPQQQMCVCACRPVCVSLLAFVKYLCLSNGAFPLLSFSLLIWCLHTLAYTHTRTHAFTHAHTNTHTRTRTSSQS